MPVARRLPGPAVQELYAHQAAAAAAAAHTAGSRTKPRPLRAKKGGDAGLTRGGGDAGLACGGGGGGGVDAAATGLCGGGDGRDPDRDSLDGLCCVCMENKSKAALGVGQPATAGAALTTAKFPCHSDVLCFACEARCATCPLCRARAMAGHTPQLTTRRRVASRSRATPTWRGSSRS